jgi:thioredoxin 1
MTAEPTRTEVDGMAGAVVLEFGAGWCPICQAARPLIDGALTGHPGVKYLRIEDGKGKPLGRSFGVKLWPTLIVLRDGRELTRLVRPRAMHEVTTALQELSRAE